MKTLTIIMLTVLLMGCATFENMFKNIDIDDYQPITNTFYEIAVLALIEKGDCVPTQLRTDVIPIMEKLDKALKKDEFTINSIITVLCEIKVIYDKDLKTELITKTGICLLMTSLNNMGFIDTPLKGNRLEIVKSLIALNLSGMRAAAKAADDFNGWCK